MEPNTKPSLLHLTLAKFSITGPLLGNSHPSRYYRLVQVFYCSMSVLISIIVVIITMVIVVIIITVLGYLKF